MSAPSEIKVQIDSHPSGRLTLKERHVSDNNWIDISEVDLRGNLNAASFYQAVAKRLAQHAREGVRVISYTDTGNKC